MWLCIAVSRRSLTCSERRNFGEGDGQNLSSAGDSAPACPDHALLCCSALVHTIPGGLPTNRARGTTRACLSSARTRPSLAALLPNADPPACERWARRCRHSARAGLRWAEAMFFQSAHASFDADRQPISLAARRLQRLARAEEGRVHFKL